MKTPLTLPRLRTHLTYSSWKYILLIVLCIFGWNLFFTTTAYRPPEEKKVDLFIYASGDQELTNALLARIWHDEVPEMEEVQSIIMLQDPTYGAMQLTTYLYAGEGDIYVLPKDEYQNYAATGAFIELEDDADLMALCEELGIDLTRGWRRNSDTGERHLYGIPTESLTGLNHYFVNTSGTCMSLMINGGNLDNAMTVMKALLREGANTVSTDIGQESAAK